MTIFYKRLLLFLFLCIPTRILMVLLVKHIDKKFFRPSEVDFLKGDYSKAKKYLKWKPSISTNQLIEDMIKFELSIIR